MARYSLFVLKVPLNTNQLTNSCLRDLQGIWSNLYQIRLVKQKLKLIVVIAVVVELVVVVAVVVVVVYYPD